MVNTIKQKSRPTLFYYPLKYRKYIKLTNTAGDVDNLHASVVQRDKAEEEVQVSGTEHHRKQGLGFA